MREFYQNPIKMCMLSSSVSKIHVFWPYPDLANMHKKNSLELKYSASSGNYKYLLTWQREKDASKSDLVQRLEKLIFNQTTKSVVSAQEVKSQWLATE